MKLKLIIFLVFIIGTKAWALETETEIDYIEIAGSELAVDILILSILFTQNITTEELLSEESNDIQVASIKNLPRDIDLVYRGYLFGFITGLLQIPISFVNAMSPESITFKYFLYKDTSTAFQEESLRIKEEMLSLDQEGKKQKVAFILADLKKKFSAYPFYSRVFQDTTLINNIFLVLEQSDYDVIGTFTTFSQTNS